MKTIPDDMFVPTIVGGIDNSGIADALPVPCSRGCGRKAWISRWGQNRIQRFPATKVICMYCNVADAASGRGGEVGMPTEDNMREDEKRSHEMTKRVCSIVPGSLADNATTDTFLLILSALCARWYGPTGMLPVLDKLGEIHRELKQRNVLYSDSTEAMRVFRWAVDQYLDMKARPVMDTLKKVDEWVAKRKMPRHPNYDGCYSGKSVFPGAK